MSRAKPMDLERREQVYRLQSGRSELTPAQERRQRHKRNDAARPVPVRIGRLRRRYDRVDQAKVQLESRQVAAWVRDRIAYSRFAPKPGSKRQIARARAPRRTP